MSQYRPVNSSPQAVWPSFFMTVPDGHRRPLEENFRREIGAAVEDRHLQPRSVEGHLESVRPQEKNASAAEIVNRKNSQA